MDVDGGQYRGGRGEIVDITDNWSNIIAAGETAAEPHSAGDDQHGMQWRRAGPLSRYLLQTGFLQGEHHRHHGWSHRQTPRHGGL